MPTEHIVALLVVERNRLTRAIEVLQGTSRGGRPRKSAVPAIDAAPTPDHTRKRIWSDAMRQAARRRSKAMWAAKRRKAAKKG